MNNRYINSFIFFLLIISLVVINFNQEEEPIAIEQDEEIVAIDTTITTSSTTTSSTTTSSTTTSSTTTSSTTTSSTTTSSSTTIPPSTTTVYTGPFGEYAGFEGSNQTTLEALAKELPTLMLQIIDTNNITIINGCHQYGASLVGRCPYGVWDPSGTNLDLSLIHI